ncbi:hypothetical protein F4808DRAFT_455178 [Astrocystis sublimbata]|nr:hypothetical protein F4808DRAFT_455178 [Astrocystis sublimbata]
MSLRALLSVEESQGCPYTARSTQRNNRSLPIAIRNPQSNFLIITIILILLLAFISTTTTTNYQPPTIDNTPPTPAHNPSTAYSQNLGTTDVHS